MIRFTLLLFALLLSANFARAGTGYEVTSSAGDKVITYEVKFGGGKLFEQHTAFDPGTRKFVYLTWRRGADAPKPAATIWDHETGRTIDLYDFPGAAHPLPVIPSMEAMKVCPMTGDKKLTAKAIIAYD